MKKAHKDFLTRTHTQGTLSIVYDYSIARKEYTITLQNSYDNNWSDDGVIETDTSFARIEPVWVFLCKQDSIVWLKTKRRF